MRDRCVVLAGYQDKKPSVPAPLVASILAVPGSDVRVG